jgi:predicted transglutaminase-like cysteine proteinase
MRTVAAFCAVWIFVGLPIVFSAPDVDQMRSSYLARWGDAAMPRFLAWRDFLSHVGAGSDLDKLKKVNDFFNRSVRFVDDVGTWGQNDYWATPLETLGKGQGDCEDYVIAKYYSLVLLGVSVDKLRLIYVQARTGSGSAGPTQAHMVLAYYAEPDEEPLVLDNLVGDVRLASRRPDLSPVFSFNTKGIFSGAGTQVVAPAVGAGRLSRWEDLLKRVALEGF